MCSLIISLLYCLSTLNIMRHSRTQDLTSQLARFMEFYQDLLQEQGFLLLF
ncbi:unnamed protein product [Moneuplotes crassus]|uniref:Uncharacterized protein n=1 Tax=Euplotes crassus TaxID=5936 RepID=A0AAD1XWP6_EUPCR|nr:unnamed protein product [Moneuplotes crassus]